MIGLLLISNFSYILYMSGYKRRRDVIEEVASWEEKFPIVAFTVTFDMLRYYSF